MPRPFLAVVLALAAGPAFADAPAVRWDKEKGTAVEVTGLTAKDLAALKDKKLSADEWAAVLSVRVASLSADAPPMAGTYSVAGDVLRFEPRYPLSKGVRYKVAFAPSKLPTRGKDEKAVEVEVLIPKPEPKEKTRVAAVYPSANTLPENHLRFYVHFSAPMSRGEAYNRLTLLGEDGKPVPRPFLELGEELWDGDGKRFTLLLDPGRVKKGLVPREEEGPVLVAGKKYTLVVDAAWEDANGFAMGGSFQKEFKAGPAAEKGLDPKDWKVSSPKAGTRSAVEVTFPAPLDHALLQRMIEVRGPDGKLVVGTIAATEKETRWSFTPSKEWAAGKYELAIDTWLEDPCGNRVGKPFEVDVFHPIQKEIKTETVTRPFEVK